MNGAQGLSQAGSGRENATRAKDGPAAAGFRGLRIEYEPPARLRPAPSNPRTITAEARAALRRGIEAFGLVDPIVARRQDRRVLGGHQRLAVAGELGLERVPVVYLDGIDDDEAAALTVLLNNPSAQGSWDMAKLAEIIRGFRPGFDASITGFDAKALTGLRAWGQPEPDEGPPAEIDRWEELCEKWKVARGQLWAIGRHRLLCGDATKTEDVARLMNGARAVMLWTDPPYGVEYVGKTKAALTIENDDAAGLPALLRGAFAAANAHLEPGAPFYIAHPAGPLSVVFAQQAVEVGWRVHQTLVWVKDTMVLGHTDYHYRHEPVLYGYTPGPGRPGRGNHAGSRRYGDHTATTVFLVDRPQRSELHPTMKPVPLIRQHLRNSSPEGGIVLDLFLGSGSTMVAAQQLGRTCVGLDLDPRFVAVTLDRLAAMGLRPELVR